jgi:hypothetical protein
MSVTASKLRHDIYRILDRVLETGVPVEVEHRGRILRIVPDQPPDKLAALRRRDDYLRCDPEELVGLHWFNEWRP